MSNGTGASVTSSRRDFAIPVELLRIFKNDVRMFPIDPHPNGYITFDREMLIAVLEHGNDAQRAELANSLKKMAKAGGELVIMQR
jgi:hypothetical protein